MFGNELVIFIRLDGSIGENYVIIFKIIDGYILKEIFGNVIG